MAKAFRIPAIFSIDPTSAPRLHRSMMLGARLLFCPLALLALVALALHLGVWQKEFKIAGPFAAESSPARHSLLLAVPQDMRPKWWVESLLSDDNRHPHRSDLRLWIDGHEMGPPHTAHETIRNGGTTSFSHWGTSVYFSLPPGVQNSSETIATLGYRVRPPFWLTLALAVASGSIAWLLYHDALRFLLQSPNHATTFVRRIPHSRAVISFLQGFERVTATALRAPYGILAALCCAAMIASAAYVFVSLFALATGWALPTTALILWSPIAQWAAQKEPYLGYLLVTLAGFGATVTWIASSKAHCRQVEADELSLRRLLAWCGFPIVTCAFVFCISTMWAGIVRPGDPHFANIGGLVPFTDAANYLAAAHDQAKDSFWNFVALRRPLAAAFRSVLLVFGNFSLHFVLLIQACMIAGAVCFAAHSVMRWRGIWAGIAFFALTYIYARTFVPTTFTEPLGLFWALLSIPFFIEAFVSGAALPALMAFTMTTIALMTRMGSMFTIPALMVWLVWKFGRGTAAKLRIFAAAVCIVLGILGLNSLLGRAYGTAGQNSSSGNLAYVVCGLTMGTDWQGCLPKLASEGKTLQGGEEAFTGHLYSMAWDNFRAEPGVFFERLTDGAEEFATHFPNVIWEGYGTAIAEPDWLFRNTLTAICLIGLLYIAVLRTRAIELTFWALLWTSIVASSSIVYFDDGSRALAASHPLIALFFAMGMSSPVLTPERSFLSSRMPRYGALGLIVAAGLFVFVPWMAHHFSPIEAMVGGGLFQKQDEAVVFGGRRMSGFLVVEDGIPLRRDLPMLHLADFNAIIRQSDVESYQGLLNPVMPPLPFGLVFAPRLEKGVDSGYLYIVPAEVIERRDVPVWRLHLKKWGYKPSGYGEYWFYVTQAEPWHR
jgi:hypothetical protein